MTMSQLITTPNFHPPVQIKVLGAQQASEQKPSDRKISAPKPAAAPRKALVFPSLKQGLLGLASAAVLAALTPSAATAQLNDVDAFNGAVNADCTCLLYTSPSPRD